MTLTIITNNVPRFTVDGFDLTPKEAEQFDYFDDITEGTFFRYRGQVYDLGEFMRVSHTDTAGDPLNNWDGYHTDTYFSGICIKLSADGESVIVGRYYA